MDSLFSQYEKLVDFLGQVLGNHCEIALLDLRDGKNCITSIVNGKNSGRTVGAPLTDFAARIIESGTWKTLDYECNYKGITSDNKIMRSSTFFIKSEQRLLGMLCINIDTTIFKNISEAILKLGGADLITNDLLLDNPKQETLSGNINSVISQTIAQYTAQYMAPVERLSQREKIRIIENLDKKDVFMVKGAVNEVAYELRCSEATIYRYLSKLQSGKKGDLILTEQTGSTRDT